MFTSTMHVRALLLTGALLFGLTTGAAAQRSFDHDEVIEERFQVRPGEALHLRSDLGSIRVDGTSGNEVVVRVIKGVNDLNEREARALFDRFEVAFEQTRQGIEVEGRFDRPSAWGGRNRLQVAYEISVPQAYSVDLNTSGGSISVAALRGDAKVKTSGGSVRVGEIEGLVTVNTSGGSITAEALGERASLRTSGGSITVRGCDGPVEAHTSGGSITAEVVRGDVEAHTSGGSIRLGEIFGAVDAHTSGGSITAELIGQPGRPVSLRTSGGSVRLAVDAGIQAEVDAEASGGRVRSDLPVTGQLERSRLRGTLNGGGPLLTLRSSGGSVSIEQR